VEWEEGLGILRKKISYFVEKGDADQVFILDGYDRGMLSAISHAFLKNLGSESYFVDRSPNPAITAFRETQGQGVPPAYDLENTRFLLSFGVPLLEGWQSPMQGQRAIGSIRGGRSQGDPRFFVQVDVRASKTSDLADRFFKIKPGSAGAFALAIAYVLIRYDLYDNAFVREHCFGFEDWRDKEGVTHQGFKSFVLKHFHPEGQEKVTGVPAEEVIRLAREFAGTRPAMAIADGPSLGYGNGTQTAIAVMALNALVGSLGVSGGIFPSEELPHLPFPWEKAGPNPPSSKKAEVPPPPDLSRMIERIKKTKKKIGVLLCLHSNPFFPAENATVFRELLGEDTFVVSFSPYPDETSQNADLILPDHSFLERWQDAVGPRSYPYALVGVTQPVCEPLFDTRDSLELILDLARELVPKGRKLFPWESGKEVLQWLAEGIHTLKRGSVFTNEQEANEIAKMEQRGWWIQTLPEVGVFWDAWIKKGGWWDPGLPQGLWGKLFATPSNRFEFYSQLSGALPHFKPPEFMGSEKEDSLLLHVVYPMVPNTALASSLPWVRGILSGRFAWETWMDIHPKDAKKRGIHDRDLVGIRAEGKEIPVRARVSERVQEGLLCVPHGLGRPAGGAWARTRGTNPDALIPWRTDPLWGIREIQGLRVQLRPLQGGLRHA
jgi:anaerobic selenocysteine-containing dehydrogenase